MKNNLPKNVRYFVNYTDGDCKGIVYTSQPYPESVGMMEGCWYVYINRQGSISNWYSNDKGILISPCHKEITYQEALDILGLENETSAPMSITVKVNKWFSAGLQKYWFSRGFGWVYSHNDEPQYETEQQLNLNADDDFSITYGQMLSTSISLDITKDWDKIVEYTEKIVAFRDVPKYKEILEFVYDSKSSDTIRWRKIGVTSEAKYYIKGFDLEDKNIEKTFILFIYYK